MSNFDELLRDNADFARTSAKDRVPAIPFIPNKQVYILTCIAHWQVAARPAPGAGGGRSSHWPARPPGAAPRPSAWPR
jgi:hypothetical protein